MFSERTTLQKLLLLKALSGGGQYLVERTALGNPLTFGTDVSKPLKSLLIPFTPQQEGSGDPSPQNIRSILPWNGLTVFGGGKNLLKYTIGQTKQNNGVNYEVLSDGGQSCEGTATATSYAISSLRTVLHAGNYTVSVSGAVNMETVIIKNGAYFRQISGNGYSTFSITEDTEIGCYSFASNGDTVDETIYIQLEAGQTATAYEPYKPITETDISFPSPVYGGTLDVVSGVLTVEWAFRTETGQNEGAWSGMTFGDNRRWVLNKGAFGDLVPKNNAQRATNYFKNASSGAWSAFFGSIGNFLCYVPKEVCEDKEAWLEYLAENPLQICYELDTPVEIQLTPAQITALVGDNTIWSDADGSMTGVYLVSSKYAEEHPVGGLGSGLRSGLLGSGTEDNPEDPAEDPIEDPADDPEEEIPDNTEEGSESDD